MTISAQYRFKEIQKTGLEINKALVLQSTVQLLFRKLVEGMFDFIIITLIKARE